MTLLGACRLLCRKLWSRPRSAHSTRRRALPHLEAMEGRYAPATPLSHRLLTYRDDDGARVAVTLSSPILSSANIDSIFTFAPGPVSGEQLQKINLAGVRAHQDLTGTVAVSHRNHITFAHSVQLRAVPVAAEVRASGPG